MIPGSLSVPLFSVPRCQILKREYYIQLYVIPAQLIISSTCCVYMFVVPVFQSLVMNTDFCLALELIRHIHRGFGYLLRAPYLIFPFPFPLSLKKGSFDQQSPKGLQSEASFVLWALQGSSLIAFLRIYAIPEANDMEKRVNILKMGPYENEEQAVMDKDHQEQSRERSSLFTKLRAFLRRHENGVRTFVCDILVHPFAISIFPR